MSQVESIKELRALTQAGISDCKKALEKANWDMQIAVDIIKTEGKNIVSGREGAVTSEGLITVAVDQQNKFVCLLETNCQTDFAAKSQEFKEFSEGVLIEFVTSLVTPSVFDVNCEEITNLKNDIVSKIRENVVIKRWAGEQVFDDTARVFHYMHNNNKLGVAISMRAPSVEVADSEAFKNLGIDLAMQVAAMNPISVSIDKLPLDLINRQQKIFDEQVAGKPIIAQEKILVGKFNKFYTDVCLLEQESVIKSKTQIKKIVEDMSKELGGEISIINFVRLQVGG